MFDREILPSLENLFRYLFNIIIEVFLSAISILGSYVTFRTHIYGNKSVPVFHKVVQRNDERVEQW